MHTIIYRCITPMEEFYTVNQAAMILKVHPLTVRRYIKDGKLKARRAGGNVRVSASELHAFTQDFIVRQKEIEQGQFSAKTHTAVTAFSFNDSIFQVKARGFSLSKLDQG